MRICSLVRPGLFAFVIALALPVFAQEADNALPPAGPTTGKFVFTFTVTVSSTVPKNAVVACKVTASVSETSQNITQQGNGIATPGGGKATCIVNMPYSWALATPTKDTVHLNTHVELDYGFEVTATNGAATLVVPSQANSTDQTFGTIVVPLNGSTTNESVSATI